MVYLMHVTNIDSRLHKIGFSSNVERRRRELSREFCTPLVLIGSIQVDDGKMVETWFHELFARERVDGELFLLDDRQVALWLALATVIARSQGCILNTAVYEKGTK